MKEMKSYRSIPSPHPVHSFTRILKWPSLNFTTQFKNKFALHNYRLRCTYMVNFVKIHPDDFEIRRARHFFTKNFLKTSYQIKNFECRKKENILAILFLHILHVKFQKASFNSNRDIRHNIAGDSGDGDGTQKNTSSRFLNMGVR